MDETLVIDAIAAMGARTRGEHVAADTPELAAELARLRKEELGLLDTPVGRTASRLPEPIKNVLRRLRGLVRART